MRSFTPFGDPWKLEIQVPYSLLVSDGDLSWTCGQVPLDSASKVLAPGDLLGQTRIVCDHIEAILGKNGIPPSAIGKLVLYYVKQGRDDADRMMAYCRERFGNRPVLVPVAVPYFYYDGLLLEVDAFGSAAPDITLEQSGDGTQVGITDAGELSWVAVTVDPGRTDAGFAVLRSALSEFGFSSDQRLSEHWFAPQGKGVELAGVLEKAGLISDGGGLVESADPKALLVGELTYVRRRSAGDRMETRDVDDVRVILRRSGRFVWLSGRSLDPKLGLVAQTKKLMTVLAGALAAEGMDFGSVVKSTSHYIGGSTPEELYENMAVRNGYYQLPGPASTGLPVSRLADHNSRIVVDFLAIGDPNAMNDAPST